MSPAASSSSPAATKAKTKASAAAASAGPGAEALTVNASPRPGSRMALEVTVPGGRSRASYETALETLGRSVRLPTVIVRPGRPNAAASSWASGMFREPLNGEPCHLPIRRDQPHPMTGYRTVIESFIALGEMPEEKLGRDRAYVLPAHRVTPALAEQVITQVAAARGIQLSPIVDAFDARIQGIVDNWPQQVDSSRAIALGLPQPPDLATIVGQYLDDFGPR